ncbi:hypothetical protein D0Y65_006152 [Glycine soja]|uniref:Uncharacterized protein n=1 Tax=Glycine soja TaxID=3848 RepID=A0A445L8D6_GLYSO|nr:hypothetical protein D0Y65_006152 [Glycine soja]
MERIDAVKGQRNQDSGCSHEEWHRWLHARGMVMVGGVGGSRGDDKRDMGSSSETKDILSVKVKMRDVTFLKPFNGLVRGLNIEEFMDSPAIDVFLALQDRGESLVPELCVWLAIRIFSNKNMREVKELKEALAKFEEEMNMLKLELMESCQMCKKKRKRQALANNQQLKEELKSSKIAKRQAQRLLEDLQQQSKRVVAEYEDRLEDEKQHRQEAEHAAVTHQDGWMKEQQNAHELIGCIKGQEFYIKELKVEIAFWKDELARSINKDDL